MGFSTNFLFSLKDKSKVTVDSVMLFIDMLVDNGYIENNGIQYIHHPNHGPEYFPDSIEDAKKIISENGVEFINIGFRCKSKFLALAGELNDLSDEAASEQDSYFYPEVYSHGTADFYSDRYLAEWGEEVEVCQLAFSGDGLPDDIGLFQERLAELAESRQHCIKMKDILSKSFHQHPELEFEIFG